MKQCGFTLTEVLVALALSAILLLAAGRFLPLLLQENARMVQRAQLYQEAQLLLLALEKAVRRSGYCNGNCTGPALTIADSGRCLLLRWDDNSNGRWEGPQHAASDYFGWRLRQQQLEAQRGVSQCQGNGWERVTDPAFMTVQAFGVEQRGAQVHLSLTLQSGQQQVTAQRWVLRENP
ncbi:prepilin peptidase-dependent protein [Pantoea sp. A4]|uniref:prepilin peptidase-dependent protein n=1 Tax=Pantoea sp. A4 TaxID=1225184 RepID=UPI00037CE444|nr:prepilin peptidase-dependent protein [Pantoea sp. A4]